MLPTDPNNEQAFSGAVPTQTGSHKAAMESKIVLVFIEQVREKVMLQEHWIKVAQEEKTETAENQLSKQVPIPREEKKKKLEEVATVPEKKEEQDELEKVKDKLIRRLVEIQKRFDNNVINHQINFSVAVSKYGYTNNVMATNFSADLLKIILNENLLQPDAFIRNVNRKSPHVADQYKRESGQTSLSTMLKIKQAVIANKMEQNLLNDVEIGGIAFLKETKEKTEEMHIVKAQYESEQAQLAAEAKETLPETEYQAFMQSMQEPSAPPQPTYTPPIQIPEADLIPEASMVYNTNGLPIAEAVIATDSAGLAHALNVNDVYLSQFGVAPTPQFTQCAKSYIEDDLVPAIQQRDEAVEQAFVEAVTEFTPSIVKALADSSAPPAEGNDMSEPSAPPAEENVWKPPVPRPPMGYNKPKND